jgi:transposase
VAPAHLLGVVGGAVGGAAVGTGETAARRGSRSGCRAAAPKHASWINQIEIWFSILVRKLLRRGNFISKAYLKQTIAAFIAYFNQAMAKPCRWTMQGRPLTV